jgi:hypothetical protein
MKIAIRSWSMLTLALLPLLLTSCVESKSEMLIGRWFNRSNSIRFNSDSTLEWNATGGRATGRFYFDAKVKRVKQDVPVKNLTVSMTRRGQSIFGEFEMQYIGRDRMRLTRMNRVNRGRPQDSVPAVIVLKRAEAEDDGKAAQPAKSLDVTNVSR